MATLYSTEALELPHSTGDTANDMAFREVFARLQGLEQVNADAASADLEALTLSQLSNATGADIPKGTLLGFSSGAVAVARADTPIQAWAVTGDLVGNNAEFVPVTDGIVEILVESGAEVTPGNLAYLSKNTSFPGHFTETAPSASSDFVQPLGLVVGETDAETGLARVLFRPQVYGQTVFA